MSSLTPDKLLDLVDPKSPSLLQELGGVSGLAEKLNSSCEKGLVNPKEAVEIQKTTFGANVLPEPISVTFLEFVIEATRDKTLIILMIAAVAEICIGIWKSVSEQEYIKLVEGSAIVIAVLVVIGIK